MDRPSNAQTHVVLNGVPELAAFVSRTTFEGLGPEAVHASKRCLLDWLGVTLGAVDHESSTILFRLFERLHPNGDASYALRGQRGSVLDVALVHGHQCHVMDFDETHGEMFVHLSSSIFAALLPLAETRHLSGKALITAHVAGVEAAARLLRHMYPSHYDRGWHTTGTIGTLAAAASVARVLGLDAASTMHALGIAASQMAGLHENRGSMSKAFHAGKAASNGLLAALLAADGFTSRDSCFDGSRGAFALYSEATGPFRQTIDAGDWEVLRIAFKPYACGISFVPIIDAALAVRERTPIDQIALVEVIANATVIEILSAPDPRDGLHGRVSPEHCAAVALLDGQAQPVQFSDERVTAADARALRQKVKLVLGAGLSPEQAGIRVHLRNGTVVRADIDAALGSPGNPLSDKDLEGKFLGLMTPLLGARAGEVVQVVWELDALADGAELVSLFAVREGQEATA